MSWFFPLLTAHALAATSLPFFDSTDLTPYWGEGHPATMTTLKAVDQNGTAVTEKAFEGHASLVNFFFAACGSECPLMMRHLQSAQRKLKNIHIYSFSVKPEHDQPELLKAFAEFHQLDVANWSLLTGRRDDIYRVGRDVFKADGTIGPKADTFIHGTNVYLLDRDRRIRGIYDTRSSKEMDLLAHDLNQL